MKKRISLISLIVIIFLILFLSSEFSYYYSTPEEALKNERSDSINIYIKKVITQIDIGSNKVIFYINQDNNLNNAEFIKRRMFGKIGYKVTTFGTMYLEDNSINAEITNPADQVIILDRSNPLNNVLYGFSKHEEISFMRVNGNKPTLVPFEVNDMKFTLFYLVGPYDISDLTFTQVK